MTAHWLLGAKGGFWHFAAGLADREARGDNRGASPRSGHRHAEAVHRQPGGWKALTVALAPDWHTAATARPGGYFGVTLR
jgi:hypothetical protein